MSHRRITLSIVAVVVLAVTAAHGQTDLDGDGLYDVEDYAADNGIDLGSVTTIAWYWNEGIEDLDGASSLINVQWLLLDHNAITSIESGDFDGLSNLQYLGLDFNAITSIESGDFSGLGNLQELYLRDNAITSIESGDFDGLTNLQMLRLHDNAITSIESGDFSGLGNLQTLYLYRNAITSIESGDFSGLGSLQELNLHDNAITSIESGAFSGLSSLQYLLLDFNAITSIESGGFSGLSNLAQLCLYCNAITSIESGDFSGLGSLERLYLDHNAIAAIESGAFADMSNLTYLNMYDNALTELNFTAADFSNLDWFQADTGEITGLVLDDAILSGMSFSKILFVTNDITDASLVGTDLGDTASLSPLLGLSLLGDLTVDAALYAAWQGDLDAWDAHAGHVLTVMGEFDGDGDVDADDIATLIDNMGDPAYDLDGDGDSDEDDLIYMIEHLVQWSRPGGESGVGTKRGDANLDGLVNATDLAIMKASFGDSGVGWPGANLNLDDVVDATDLAILKANFAFVAPTGAVPEPATLLVMAAAGLPLLLKRKRKSRA